MAQTDITSLQKEGRTFKPSTAFSKQAHVQSLAQYRKLYAESIKSPQKFWARMAKETALVQAVEKSARMEGAVRQMVRRRPDQSQLQLPRPASRRHRDATRPRSFGKANRPGSAIPGEHRVLTYIDLHREVCRFANVLKRNGIVKGDRIIIYMPMVPEAAIAMLACARIGATHSVVFGGFSAQALIDRIHDCQAKMVITADGGFRRGADRPVEEERGRRARQQCPNVKRVIVLAPRQQRGSHPGRPGRLVAPRDWNTSNADCPAEKLDSEHPLFILYTSGSHRQTEGRAAHHRRLSARRVSDDEIRVRSQGKRHVLVHRRHRLGDRPQLCRLRPARQRRDDPACTKARPTCPKPDRFWRIVEKYKVTIFYTAPTAIRAFMRWGDEWPKKHDLSSLRLLGTVGEPINPEAWMWYHNVIGKKRCPIVDTWWQTETGAIMITPLPGATPTKPGSATLPFFGVDAAVVNKEGKELPANVGGYLVIRKSVAVDAAHHLRRPRTLQASVLERDSARLFHRRRLPARQGRLFLDRRPHRRRAQRRRPPHRHRRSRKRARLAPEVAEAAVVGRPDDLKGQALVAFVTLRSGVQATPQLKEELRAHVGTQIGSLAKPDDIRFTDSLPKTRSRQNHAPPAERNRRRRRRQRRHHDAGRSQRDRQAASRRGMRTMPSAALGLQTKCAWT